MRIPSTVLLLCITFTNALDSGIIFRQRRQQGGACRTPESKPGECLNIKRCPSLFKLLIEQSSKPEVREFLRNSQCGYEGNDPKVCCPDNINNNGQNDPEDDGPFPKECGKSDISINRIVGGRPAQLRAWPWMAALGYRGQSGTIQWRCGATLITTQHVVTAAHCLTTNRPVMVRLGDLDLNRTDEGANHVDIPIAVNGITRHSAYSTRTLLNDIAIVKMKNPARFSSDIQPICLPFQQQIRSKNIVGFSPFITGWGDLKFRGQGSTRLHEAQVEVKSIPDCQNAYAKLPTKSPATIDNSVLCAGGGTKDACQGDSGGPLMLPELGKFYLIGVVSYGHKCAEPGFPGIYTRITHFTDWIRENVN